jgi:hypothetical protein
VASLFVRLYEAGLEVKSASGRWRG